MNRHLATSSILALILFALVACTAHPKRVDCEAHLQPINAAPAPNNPESAR